MCRSCFIFLVSISTMLMALAMGVRVACPQDSALPGTVIASSLHL